MSTRPPLRFSARQDLARADFVRPAISVRAAEKSPLGLTRNERHRLPLPAPPFQGCFTLTITFPFDRPFST